MAQRKFAKKTATATGNGSKGFSAEEKAAMRELLKERKASASRAESEKTVREKIASMAPSDRAIGERIHAIVTKTAPDLTPKLWYGMPAYAKDDKIVCFFQDAAKFKYRYATLGFQDAANLDDGGMWPVAFALKEMNPAAEAKIGALVKKAVS